MIEAPRLYDYEDMKAQPPMTWLLDGLLPASGFVSLTAKRGTGKSLLALAWAMSIGLARPWFDRSIMAGGVLYVAAEGCRAERLLAYERRFGVPTIPTVWWRKVALPLGRVPDIDALLQQVAALPIPPAMIVLDTWARCTVGLKENDPSDTSVAVDAVARLQHETGATVLALHHPPHSDPDRGRGSTAFDAAADTALLLKSTDSGLVLKVTKQRDGETPEPIHLRVSPYAPSAVIELDSPAPAGMSANEAAALEALRRIMVPGGVTATEWLKASGLAERTFYEARAKLVERQEASKNGARYLLTATAEVLR